MSGEIAPTLPIGNKKFLCVEYPGYVKKVERALNTLGGEKAMSEAFSNDRTIDLRYRPKDIFSHPISGDIIPTSNFLVKVTRRVKKDRNGEVIEEATPWKTEILGTITHTVRFRAMADFQYLLPKENKTRQLKEALSTGDVEKIVQYKIATDDDDLDNLRSIPPPLFSPVDVPYNYEYRQNTSVVRVRVKLPDGSYKIKLVNRSIYSNHAITSIKFDAEKVPTRSWHHLTESLEDLEKETIEAVGQLFEERPIWTRFAIRNRLHSKYNKFLPKALVFHAYTFTDGSWRDCWIKYGIDPRKDNAYHKYQTVDVRRYIHIESNEAEKIVTRRHRPTLKKAPKEEKGELPPQNKHILDGVSVPEGTSLYQLCDITDPQFQSLIYNPDYITSVPSKTCGFYYRCVFERLRKNLKKKIYAIKDGNKLENFGDLEKGLKADIAAEIEKAALNQNNDLEDDKMDDDNGSVSTTDVEKAAKEAFEEINKSTSSKRLKDVVDDYMNELANEDSQADEDMNLDAIDLMEEYETEEEEYDIKEEYSEDKKPI